ncbi:MAG: MFS transporter, partial [Pseudomonadota bacterium]|nr:MFS transporter [Pseudomonadota bacterium]
MEMLATDSTQMEINKESPIMPWLVTFSAAGFFFYQFILITIFNALNEPMLKEFQITVTQLGHVSASYFIAGILSLLISGIILDRYSVRKVIITAFLVSILSIFLFAIAPNPFCALLARFLAGISGTFCFLGPMKIASRWFAPKRLALVIGLIVSYAMIGGVIAQIPITALAESVGWRYTSIILAGAGIVFLIPIITTVRDYPEHYHNPSHPEHRRSLKDLVVELKQTVFKTQNWLSGLYISLINLPVYILGAMWGTMYLKQVHHLARIETTYVTAMIFLGMMFGCPIMGWISDKMQLRKRPMAIFGLASIIPFIFLIQNAQYSLSTLMLIFFAIGFFIGIQVIGYPLVAESNPKELNATAQGLVSTVVIMG